VGAIHFDDVETSFGKVTFVWKGELEPRVVRVLLPNQLGTMSSLFPNAARSRNGEVSRLLEAISEFLAGEMIRLPLDLLDLDSCSRFQREVILAEYEVPRGFVTTYGRIARHLGAPHSSRAVGRALATNPFPIVIPCHRAVRSGGDLGGYQGGAEMKGRLLEMEGVPVVGGRASMSRVFY